MDYFIGDVKYYMLDDGRVWSIHDAKFVDSVPVGETPVPCRDESGVSSVEGLIHCLAFYKFPKGEFKTDEEFASEVREKRNQLLAETDYLVMPDYPLSEEKFQAVAAYRQSLRDVPMQAGFPRQIDWPVKP